jgi:hypothetical protein
MQILEKFAAVLGGHVIDLNPSAIERSAKSLILVLILVLLWSVTHQYRGLAGDAELYAVQALARIHPNLFHDLFLRNRSQDTFTVFSPFYASCISILGLRSAALTLTIAFKVWFFIAAWVLARRLSNSRTAFLAVASLIVTLGSYGAYGVFQYAEDWVTARSLAEALVITALAFHFGGSRVVALLLASGTIFVHPLMALPGLLLLIFVSMSHRISIVAAAATVLLSLGIALAGRWTSSEAHFFTVMDANWLEVVRERSQFLFLQLWRAADWELNARPFLSLTVTALVIDDPQVRKLCAAAMLVGATGLAVAATASLIGPLSVLLQGQAWRWVWITAFSSMLLLVPTVLAVWRDPKFGLLCAFLLISAWAVPAIYGAACLVCVVTLWLLRDRINDRTAWYLRRLAVAVGIAFMLWIVKNCWGIFRSPHAGSGIELPSFIQMRDVPGLPVFAVVITGLLAYWIRSIRSVLAVAAICGVLIAATALLWPRTFRDVGRDGTPAEIAEFSDWRSVIPLDSNVFVVPAHNSASFAWFTLERPSYLTVDQSSGVAFSRATALEVRRRSQVLLPLMDPDWQLLSNMKKTRSGNDASSPSSRTFTRDRLISLCSDPQLNFVVARQNVGFDPIRHTPPGPWKDWNLYDCRRIQNSNPPA